jgi:hypothetical protein
VAVAESFNMACSQARVNYTPDKTPGRRSRQYRKSFANQSVYPGLNG